MEKETDGDERWSNLPDHLKEIISHRLDFVHNIRLASVSVPWRRVALETITPCLPWLLISCTHQDRVNKDQEVQADPQDQVRAQNFSFLNLTDGKAYDVKIPHANARGARLCYGSSEGWVFMLNDRDKVKSCFLLNPFSRTQVKLPNPQSILYRSPEESHFTFHENVFHNVLWSSVNNDDCVVIALNHIYRLPLVFCRPGDKSWTAASFTGFKFKSTGMFSCSDAVFYRGRLHLFPDYSDYAIKKRLCIIDFTSREPVANVYDVFFVPKVEPIARFHRKEYLVESQGGCLLMVYRYWKEGNSFFNSITFKFLVFKLECKDNNDDQRGATQSYIWVKQSRLEGDQALFLGRSCSISLSASKYPGLKENSIYFADDLDRNGDTHLSDPYNPYGYSPRPVYPDRGIYHLEDDKIDQFLPCDSYIPRGPPPIWIKPPI